MIKIQNLQKVIDQNTVLNIDHLQVKVGTIEALVGPAGSGKNVLIDLLLGRTQPTSGTLHLAGFEPFNHPSDLSIVTGILFAEDSLYMRLSPRANLMFHCRLRGLPKTRADDVLQQVGLRDQADTKLKDLPSGLLRRLAFGRALLHEPRILLCIEPFERCDQASITLLSQLMREQAQAGAAVLILASDLTDLHPVCNRIHLLRSGRLEESLEPETQQEQQLPFKIPVRLEGRVALLNPSDIFYIEADEGRTYLHTADEKLPSQFTLGELETRLARSGFFRAHRGYLVNLQHVTEVIPFTRNSFSLRLGNEERSLIPLSKSAAAELRELLDY